MAISLGSTTYTAVTWTTGDIATEIKMDNMVANDQAYDSHAAQGLLLNNEKGLFGIDSGAANRVLIGINASDVIEIGKNNEADHTVINAGTSKLVKIKVLTQNDTTNAYKENSVVLTGWGHSIGNGGNSRTNKTVTFGITFSEIPIIINSAGGIKDASDPTSPGDTSASGRSMSATTDDDAVDSFISYLQHIDDTTLPATTRYIYKWIAIGQLN